MKKRTVHNSTLAIGGVQLEDEEERVEVLQLIYSRKASTKTFNIHVPAMPERYDVMNALLQDEYINEYSGTIRSY
jgi:DNA-binding transcriptional regulator LsrR (DeoR family)